MDLWQKQLVPFSRVTSLKRDAARLEGERGQLDRLQGLDRRQDRRGRAADHSGRSGSPKQGGRGAQRRAAKIAELSERKIAAEDQLRHIDIRAPQTGRVHELAVHTVGGVITPGETIMLIVPDNDMLSVEARCHPMTSTSFVPDQPVTLRFSAFNQRTTPQTKWQS